MRKLTTGHALFVRFSVVFYGRFRAEKCAFLDGYFFCGVGDTAEIIKRSLMAWGGGGEMVAMEGWGSRFAYEILYTILFI